MEQRGANANNDLLEYHQYGAGSGGYHHHHHHHHQQYPLPPLSPQQHHIMQQPQPQPQQPQQQTLIMPPLQSSIHNLRTLFSLLKDEEFESEVEVERQRRYGGDQRKRPAVTQNVRNNNRKRAPAALQATDASPAEEEEAENNNNNSPRRKKRKNNVTTLAAAAAARMPHAAATAAAAPYNNNDSFPSPSPPPTNQTCPPLQAPTMDNFSPSPHAPAAAGVGAAATRDNNESQEQQPDESVAVAAAPTPRPAKKTWTEHYLELQQFRQSHGHVYVPHTRPEYASLYHWVALQKSCWRKFLKNNGRPDEQDDNDDNNDADNNNEDGDDNDNYNGIIALTLAQVNSLVQVGLGTLDQGPINSKSEKEAAIWEERFAELQAYKTKHRGCVDVPKDKNKGEYYALSRWVETQRFNFRNRTGELPNKKRGMLTDDQLERLAAIGFRFVTNKKTDFSVRFAQITEYKRQHGHTRVPKSYQDEQGNRLGVWVAGVKRQFKKNKLAAEKVEQLNSIEFEFGDRIPPNSERKKKQPPKAPDDDDEDDDDDDEQAQKPKAKGRRKTTKKGGGDSNKKKSSGVGSKTKKTSGDTKKKTGGDTKKKEGGGSKKKSAGEKTIEMNI